MICQPVFVAVMVCQFIDVVHHLYLVEGDPEHQFRPFGGFGAEPAAGFAGIENPLFYNDNTKMLFGDAKAVLQELVSEFKKA